MNRVFEFTRVNRVVQMGTGVLLVISILSLLWQGLNLGLDFTGGTLVELRYQQSAPLDEIREQLTTAGYDKAVVQSFGAATDVVVRMSGADPQLGEQLAASLTQGEHQPQVMRVDFVGPAVGAELRDQGGMGMLVALLGILVYVSFRFQWKFSCGAVLSLFHDVIIVLGVFSLFQVTFDLSVLAAILAVIGYSLNDTIVVYDRIRENMRLLRKASLEENINRSLSQTLLRTLATSVSTVLAVGALLVLGGESLSGFSLALLVGIVSGTFSSIYIATMLLLRLKLTREELIPPPPEEVEAAMP